VRKPKWLEYGKWYFHVGHCNRWFSFGVHGDGTSAGWFLNLLGWTADFTVGRIVPESDWTLEFLVRKLRKDDTDPSA
jgi:hypothetical protein